MFRVRVSQSIAAAVVAVAEDDDNEACAAAAAAAVAFCYRLEETSLGDDDTSAEPPKDNTYGACAKHNDTADADIDSDDGHAEADARAHADANLSQSKLPFILRFGRKLEAKVAL